MGKLFIAILILILSAFSAPQASAGKYDGYWGGEGYLTCPSLGIKHEFQSAVYIAKSKFSAEGNNDVLIYSMSGKINRL